MLSKVIAKKTEEVVFARKMHRMKSERVQVVLAELERARKEQSDALVALGDRNAELEALMQIECGETK